MAQGFQGEMLTKVLQVVGDILARLALKVLVAVAGVKAMQETFLIWELLRVMEQLTLLIIP
jgi:hypothetical protein